MFGFDDVSLFVLGVSSLLPLVNPAGTALIINPYFSGCTNQQRKSYAFTIVFFCFGIGLVALFLGSWLLKAMGISIPTTQMAGGVIIARLGLSLLDSKGGECVAIVRARVNLFLFCLF